MIQRFRRLFSSVNALAVVDESLSVRSVQVEQVPLRPGWVELEVSHCGLCHSDVHLASNAWKSTQFPLVCGHEAVGRVTKVAEGPSRAAGSSSSSSSNISINSSSSSSSSNALIQEGQRVGVGWTRSSCGHCLMCRRGHQQLCTVEGGSAGTALLFTGPGAFADRIRVNSQFAFPIPDQLASEDAAPMLCAGITAYAPLRQWASAPTDRIAVVGLGGVGYYGLQFARALGLGNNLTAVSTSPSKRQLARECGAAHFVVDQGDAESLKPFRRQFDLILFTSSGSAPRKQHLDLLADGGTLVLVGLPPADADLQRLPFTIPQLVLRGIKVVGSIVGGPPLIAEMLTVAATAGIRSNATVMPFAQAETGLKMVRDGTSKSPRIVLSK